MKRNLITNEYWSKDADEAILFNKIVTSLNAWKEAFDEGDYDQYAHEYDENVSAWYNRSVVLTGSAEHANEGAYRNVYGISRRHESDGGDTDDDETPTTDTRDIILSAFVNAARDRGTVTHSSSDGRQTPPGTNYEAHQPGGNKHSLKTSDVVLLLGHAGRMTC